ncbi:MAG: Rha family transcriptional regulator [Prevotella sp.]|nr:Rha family transcriptional regulator [Prevotella sp.]MBR4650916.1 Rha family transcriptional regulator [Prevotella sp.]
MMPGFFRVQKGIEIAELTGKQHKNVMQAIRNMEPAWEKVNGLKFQLGSYKDANGQMRPCYSLTKTECLYIATKFNDEARAKLVLRWEELELTPSPLSSRFTREGCFFCFHKPCGELQVKKKCCNFAEDLNNKRYGRCYNFCSRYAHRYGVLLHPCEVYTWGGDSGEGATGEGGEG